MDATVTYTGTAGTRILRPEDGFSRLLILRPGVPVTVSTQDAELIAAQPGREFQITEPRGSANTKKKN